MRNGVIIIFSNDEKKIKENLFDTILDNKLAKFCFVNNASKDKTLNKLKKIKDRSTNNISVIDVKKDKGMQAAIKAGIRYLTNNEELNPIIYLDFYNNIDFVNLKDILMRFNSKEKVMPILINKNHRNILHNVFSLDQLIHFDS